MIAERRVNNDAHLRLTFVDAEGVPRLVQFIALHVDDEGECRGVMWRDCVGRIHHKTLTWLLGRPFDTQLRTFDQLYVCRNYVRVLLETAPERWWKGIP